MANLSVLIKPSSSLCNLGCSYCFYNDLASNRTVKSYGFLDNNIVEKVVESALSYVDEYCGFAFQGGEPMLIGMGFYKNIISLQKKYNKKGVKIENTIQTNGTLIDNEWAKFFKENNFLVGISLDGPKDINDVSRNYKNGKSSYKEVIRGINYLKEYGVEYNILSVVTAYSARHINKIYSFFKKENHRYLQFIPVLDGLDGKKSFYSLNTKTYGEFLKRLFDLWYDDYISGEYVDIRYFANLVQMRAGYRPEACGMSGCCGVYCVVEGDGSVFPCDFYSTDKWTLGNIKNLSFNEMINSKLANDFVCSSLPVNDNCIKCEHYNLCRGGCRKWREEDGELRLNVLCGAYKIFFEYATPRINKIARELLLRDKSINIIK